MTKKSKTNKNPTTSRPTPTVAPARGGQPREPGQPPPPAASYRTQSHPARQGLRWELGAPKKGLRAHGRGRREGRDAGVRGRRATSRGRRSGGGLCFLPGGAAPPCPRRDPPAAPRHSPGARARWVSAARALAVGPARPAGPREWPRPARVNGGWCRARAAGPPRRWRCRRGGPGPQFLPAPGLGRPPGRQKPGRAYRAPLAEPRAAGAATRLRSRFCVCFECLSVEGVTGLENSISLQETMERRLDTLFTDLAPARPLAGNRSLS